MLFRHIRDELHVRQREISAGTGINQGSVSKILRGSFKNLDGRAYQVWRYAKRRADEAGRYKLAQSTDDKVNARLAEKISKVWDRTEEGANALLKLLDAAELMQKRRKESPGN